MPYKTSVRDETSTKQCYTNVLNWKKNGEQKIKERLLQRSFFHFGPNLDKKEPIYPLLKRKSIMKQYLSNANFCLCKSKEQSKD